MSSIEFNSRDIDYLLSPVAVRERTKALYDLALSGKTHFKVHLDRLQPTAEYVLKVIRENYPTLEIPFHSRHTHFNAAGVDRLSWLEKQLSSKSALEKAKAKIDLVVVSVLLDAGAGESWTYNEADTAKVVTRSEGLAVASLHMFMSGAFSSNSSEPLQANIEGLRGVSVPLLEKHFQVSTTNPLLGPEGRVHLLNQLAECMAQNPRIFKNGRIGDLLDALLTSDTNEVSAVRVLDLVLRHFGGIWPSRIRLGEQSLGDVWSHSALGSKNSVQSLVPFHKLSQWLTYSLLVPMLEMGVHVTDVDRLTGLAEYRNGGLLIDSGLIELRDPLMLKQAHEPQSELIIEWRALTVQLLDLIGEEVRKNLKMSAQDLPLAKVLEGGTWHAGRRIAKEKRAGGPPPLNIISDGTVF